MNLNDLENELGRLAMKFRGCLHQPDCKEQRKVIAQKYAEIIDELIESNVWDEIPAPEDMLTNEYMPERFWKYFGIR